jgi:hypothetical protein
MRMIGGQPFIGKTTRAYPAGSVIDVDHPDYREAQIAGWVTLADEPRLLKATRVYWEGGSGVTIADQFDGHVLVAAAGAPGDSARAVVYVAVSDLMPAPQELDRVTGTGPV